MKMPEEVNRVLTDRISKLLFCPTQTAVENLEKEGFRNFDSEIILCGDVMYDAVLYYKEKVKSSSILQKENLNGKPFVLATIHRAENTDNPKRLKEISKALDEIQKECLVVLPLHPRTRASLKSQNITLQAKVIDPVGYIDMLALLERCSLVLTDSGGLQKEAYFFNKYCVTLRDQTEWVELVSSGANTVVGSDPKKIVETFREHVHKKPNRVDSLYGDGNASRIIVSRLDR
jgi:UDP-GlcNAc3NAcA epimerase